MSEVRLLTPATNYAVVHLPGRQFPGVVFQGDSLNGLISDLERASTDPDPAERAESLAYVLERLCEIREGYEAVLDREGMNLPYFRQE
jgi:hypothetical protein